MNEHRPLSGLDYRAADEVLRHIPERAANSDPAAVREILAASHQRRGASRFRFVWGLRGPENRVEELESQVIVGNLSIADFEERLLRHIDNDLNTAELARFFDELEKIVARYSEIRSKVEGFAHNLAETPSFSALEEEVDNLVDQLYGSSSFYRIQLNFIHLFLAEARIEQGKESLQHKSLSANSASSLVILTMRWVKTGWSVCYNRAHNHPAAHPPSSLALFEQSVLRRLPAAPQLSSWLEEEHALGRRFLRMRTMWRCSSKPTPEPSKRQAEPLFTVKSWSDLAIGIDEYGYRAFSPAPEFGEKIRKDDSTKLVLNGPRWKELLELLAHSSDGETVSRSDLIQAFGLFKQNDGRKSLHEFDADELAALTTMAGTSLNNLNRVLADLRDKLRKQIDGPTGRGKTCLETQGDVVKAGFRVAHILLGEDDNPRFGRVRNYS